MTDWPRFQAQFFGHLAYNQQRASANIWILQTMKYTSPFLWSRHTIWHTMHHANRLASLKYPNFCKLWIGTRNFRKGQLSTHLKGIVTLEAERLNAHCWTRCVVCHCLPEVLPATHLNDFCSLVKHTKLALELLAVERFCFEVPHGTHSTSHSHGVLSCHVLLPY